MLLTAPAPSNRVRTVTAAEPCDVTDAKVQGLRQCDKGGTASPPSMVHTPDARARCRGQAPSALAADGVANQPGTAGDVFPDAGDSVASRQ